jgi:ABC-type sugar transport system ATPase subunit
VVYVTHDQIEAMTMGQRIAVMNAGKFEQIGAPNEVYGRPASVFVARFLGSPSMNVIDGQIEADGDAVVVRHEELVWRLPTADLPATPPNRCSIGFRPEAMRLDAPAGDHATMRRAVDFVEHLGNEVIVHFPEHSGAPLTARVPAAAEHLLGEGVTWSIPVAGLHLFDENGLAFFHGRDTALYQPSPSPEVVQ